MLTFLSAMTWLTLGVVSIYREIALGAGKCAMDVDSGVKYDDGQRVRTLKARYSYEIDRNCDKFIVQALANRLDPARMLHTGQQER